MQNNAAPEKNLNYPPVRHQSILLPPEHDANVCGMLA